MQTKTYFANNIPAAIEVARRELGDDALLVNSKAAPADARHFGRLEVTFASNPQESGSAQAGVRLNREAMSGKPLPTSRRSELDEIREQIAALRATGAQPATGAGDESVTGINNQVFERLCEAGLGVETARETAREIPAATLDPQSAAVQMLAGRIHVVPFVEVKPGESRTMAFIGPPGRGKTTSLVKVAVAEGLARRIPVRIYSVGAHGIGGQEQIARYAAILGVPHQSYESTANLALALNGENWKGLSLIDTRGISVSDRNEMRDLVRFFAGRLEIEKHLVLRADARSADMLHVISRFGVLEPSRLLFTGLDDAVSAGAMAEALIRSEIPATFAGTGQQIPEDLEQVDAGNLARDVWVGSWVEAPARSKAAVA